MPITILYRTTLYMILYNCNYNNIMLLYLLQELLGLLVNQCDLLVAKFDELNDVGATTLYSSTNISPSKLIEDKEEGKGNGDGVRDVNSSHIDSSLPLRLSYNFIKCYIISYIYIHIH